MRRQLEGKQYVEHYVHALTHEMKSPLAAIRGAAELLEGPLPEADRARFVASIDAQGRRMAAMVDRLLALAALEHREGLDAPLPLDLAALAGEALDDAASRAQARGVAGTPAGGRCAAGRSTAMRSCCASCWPT